MTELTHRCEGEVNGNEVLIFLEKDSMQFGVTRIKYSSIAEFEDVNPFIITLKSGKVWELKIHSKYWSGFRKYFFTNFSEETKLKIQMEERREKIYNILKELAKKSENRKGDSSGKVDEIFSNDEESLRLLSISLGLEESDLIQNKPEVEFKDKKEAKKKVKSLVMKMKTEFDNKIKEINTLKKKVKIRNRELERQFNEMIEILKNAKNDYLKALGGKDANSIGVKKFRYRYLKLRDEADKIEKEFEKTVSFLKDLEEKEEEKNLEFQGIDEDSLVETFTNLINNKKERSSSFFTFKCGDVEESEKISQNNKHFEKLVGHVDCELNDSSQSRLMVYKLHGEVLGDFILRDDKILTYGNKIALLKECSSAINELHQKLHMLHQNLSTFSFRVKRKEFSKDFEVLLKISKDIMSEKRFKEKKDMENINLWNDPKRVLEDLKNKNFSELMKGDIYSLGLVIFSTLFCKGRNPFKPFYKKKNLTRKQFLKFLKEEAEKKKDDDFVWNVLTKECNVSIVRLNSVPERIRNIIKRCLNAKEKERPTIAELIQILQNEMVIINREEMENKERKENNEELVEELSQKLEEKDVLLNLKENKEFDEIIKIKDEKIDKLEIELENDIKKIELIEKKVEEMMAKNKKLEKNNQSELESDNKKIEIIEGKLEEVMKKNEALEKKNKNYKKKFEIVIQKSREIGEKAKGMENRIFKTQKENDELRGEKKKLNEVITSLEDKIKILSKDFSEMKKKENENREQIKENEEKQIDKLEMNKLDLEKKLKLKQEENSNLLKELKENETNCENEKEEIIKKYKKELEKLKEENEKLKKRILELENESVKEDTHNSIVKELKLQIQELKEKNEKDCSDNQSEYEILKNEFKEKERVLQKEKQDLKSELVDWEKKYNIFKEKIEELNLKLEKENKNKNELNTQYKKKINGLEISMEKREKSYNEFKNNTKKIIDELEKQKEETTDLVNLKMEKIREQANVIKEKKLENKTFINQIENLEKTIKENEEKNQKLESIIQEELSIAINEKNNELQSFQDKCIGLEKDVLEKEKKIKDLEKDIKKKQLEFEEVIMELTDVKGTSEKQILDLSMEVEKYKGIHLNTSMERLSYLETKNKEQENELEKTREVIDDLEKTYVENKGIIKKLKNDTIKKNNLYSKINTLALMLSIVLGMILYAEYVLPYYW